MVLPITGPISKSENVRPFEGAAHLSLMEMSKTWYRQKRPYTKPLPFSFSRRDVLKELRNTPGEYREWDSANGTGVVFGNSNQIVTRALLPTDTRVTGARTIALNGARAKFNDALGEGAQLALMYMERKQSMDTLTARLRQMGRFVTHVRKFRFRKAFEELLDGQNPRRIPELQKEYTRREARLRRGAKAFANNFLEYRFMWSATVNDIGAAVDVLQGGVPPCVVRGKSGMDGIYNPNPYTDSFGYTTGCTHVYSWRAVCGATVYVSNPNLWLANQLGFVNPALLLYEATTLSFVANWFVNIEEFLKQWTEYWGLTVVDPFYTTKYTCSNSWFYTRPSGSPRTIKGGNKRVDVSRTVGALPAVKLSIRRPWRLSGARGLTAASLLAQKLR
nr:MAG: maturation protein [Leviviridae sp.]